MDIITPQKLYHGTTDQALSHFQSRLLNQQYWRQGRDFGEGFYTTISPAQARKWAVKTAKSHFEPVNPCVLEIELLAIPEQMDPLVFLSDSLAWARFILQHRTSLEKGHDPCIQHPDIIIGPMADNDTGKLVEDVLQLIKDVHWFYHRIIRSARGRRLDSLRLGNQVVFSSEKWESSLRLTGYYVQKKGRWRFYDTADSTESL